MARGLPARMTKPGSARRAMAGWIVRHDDSWLFVASYIGLAVVLSIWISLFWLVAVVAAHAVLECLRQRHWRARGAALLGRVAWELKLDFALILFALLLSAYMDVILGVAGLGGAARLGAASRIGLRSGARAAGWSRVVKGILISLDDLAQVLRAVLLHRYKPTNGRQEQTVVAAVSDESALPAAPEYRFAPRDWSVGDHVAIWLGAACLLLIVAAPWLTEQTGTTLLHTLAAELHPFPPAGE
jgi:hypothetical protein